MRKPKYRGWHTSQKKMYSAEQLGKDQLTISCDGQGFINVHGAKTELSTFPKMIPLEYTGLKDRNGKELFEKYKIRFNHRYLSIHSNEYLIEDLQSFFEQKGYSEREYQEDWNDFEIIGNIYENPELLETK